MKNLSTQLVNHLETQNHINPNACQITAINEIEKKICKILSKSFLNFFKSRFDGIYLYGSVGVGKSVILKALNIKYKNSEIFHFSDLIFHIQNAQSLNNKNFLVKKN